MNLSELEIVNLVNRITRQPCEPVKPLVYLLDTDEVIPEYESNYRKNKKPFKAYKQVSDNKSLSWFCSIELIELYEKWDCKNLLRFKPSTYLIEKAKAMLVSPEYKNAIARLDSPEYKLLMLRAQQFNKLITPEYIETAKTALSAFDSDLHHKDVLSRIHGYTTATEQILTLGINAQIARDMLEPHKALLESYRNWEIPKPKKKGKKYWKKIAKEESKNKVKELEEKDIKHAKEIEELNTQQKREDNAEISILKDVIKRLEKEAGEKDVINLALATAINQQDTAPTHKNNEPLIKDEWIEKGEVTRPIALKEETRASVPSTNHANKCVRIYFQQLGKYPTAKELWIIILNSQNFETGNIVECKRNSIIIELEDWDHRAFESYYSRWLIYK